ncbi:MAG: hypothetical protein NTW21_10200 [Verrucomicrobia bacterium]|nr:hypothetical protein [Verrucomicrobiota bacterium]
MKPTLHCLQLFPAFAAGLMLFPMTSQAQDQGSPPAHQEVQREAPNPERIRAMLREMQELRRAGKVEEARGIAERLHALAKDNPQLAERIKNAMKQPERPNLERPSGPTQPQHQAIQPKAEGPQRPMAQPGPAEPRHQATQPKAEGPQRPMAQPGPAEPRHQAAQPKAEKPQRPMAQPGPAEPRHQVAQPKPEGRERSMARPNRQGGWGPRMAQRNTAGPQRPMARPNRQGGWGSRMVQPNMAGPQGPMGQPNLPNWQEMPMPQPNAAGPNQPMVMPNRQGGWGPWTAQPNTAGPQGPMARPNLPNWNPSVQAKPAVPADNAPAARIQHLRQAAEHLAAAGYPEHAAKARQEISRMEAEMKQSKPQAPAPTDKLVPREAPRRDPGPQQGKPETSRLPDASAAMLNEMRKLSKQIEQLNARMTKLETRGEPRP